MLVEAIKIDNSKKENLAKDEIQTHESNKNLLYLEHQDLEEYIDDVIFL